MKVKNSSLKFQGELKNRDETDKIILHHAESKECSVFDIHLWHLCKGWSGCGYHFFIRKDGSVYTGREEEKIGAHCKGNNLRSIGICFEGNFQLEEPTEEQIQSGIALCGELRDKYGDIDIFAHKELTDTDCPGIKFPIEEFKDKCVKKKKKLDVRELQRFLNSQEIRDYENKELIEDGIVGKRTKSAFKRLKEIEM